MERKIIDLKSNNPKFNTNFRPKEIDDFKASTSEIRNSINFQNREVKVMNDYVSKEEFIQFEKRIEQNINRLESKIDNLPSQLEDKFKIMILEQTKELQTERKADRKSIITWCLTGTGVIMTGLGLIAKILNWI